MALKNLRTEEPKNQRTEELKNQRTEEPKNRGTEEQKNRFFSSSVLQFFGSQGFFRSRAFTLIELMLVVVIISALAAMVVPRLAGRTEEARRSIAAADLKGNLSLALKLFEVDNGRYPTAEQGLGALLQKPASPPVPKNWKGPYLEQEPLDPWGKPYVYRQPGTHPPRDYDLSSLGPDGVESDDDVKNWN